MAEQARYLDAKEYSKGMVYVLVNGRFVVDRGRLVRDVYPDQPVQSGSPGRIDDR